MEAFSIVFSDASQVSPPMGKCDIPSLDSHWILYETASYLVEIGWKYQFQAK